MIEYITANAAELMAAAVAGAGFLALVVKMTPTKKDDEVLERLDEMLEAMGIDLFADADEDDTKDA